MMDVPPLHLTVRIITVGNDRTEVLVRLSEADDGSVLSEMAFYPDTLDYKDLRSSGVHICQPPAPRRWWKR